MEIRCRLVEGVAATRRRLWKALGESESGSAGVSPNVIYSFAKAPDSAAVEWRAFGAVSKPGGSGAP